MQGNCRSSASSSLLQPYTHHASRRLPRQCMSTYGYLRDEICSALLSDENEHKRGNGESRREFMRNTLLTGLIDCIGTAAMTVAMVGTSHRGD